MCSSIRNDCKLKFQILGNRVFTGCTLFLPQSEMKSLCEDVLDKTLRCFIFIEG